MDTIILGISIGGTKCAASLGAVDGDKVTVLEKYVTPTRGKAPLALLDELSTVADGWGKRPEAIGITCGGPLDEKKGLILSPPNLPGWDEVKVAEYYEKRYGVPARLLNDANAGALAEWRFGAGRGYDNVVFLTFGTGFGAGVILGGRLYAGTNGMAGEIGHVRLARGGNIGYGKAGSAEGFVSGGGMAQTGRAYALRALGRGRATLLAADEGELDDITAKKIAECAEKGDSVARAVMRDTGKKLGETLAILVDILNPQAIVIGGIYARCEKVLREYLTPVYEREALAQSRAVCRIFAATLGENIDEYAAFSAALCTD